MTPKEAIETLKIAKAEVEWNYPLDYGIALDMAIEALEKQVPEKPEKEGHNYVMCPVCGGFLGYEVDCKDEAYQSPYCEGCGQALNWEDWSEGE